LQDQIIIEELCGRDRGKRAYTVTPSEPSLSVNLLGIIKRAEFLGYHVKSKGNLGITAVSNNASKLSISFLASGSATIVGAKDEQDALSIYKTFSEVS
jgi:adenylyltransferase/sulfurtransferase